METTNKISLTKKILIALGGILSCACVGFGVFHHVQNSSIEVHAENEVYRKKYNIKATYDDNSYTITFSADELNNYTFDNLNNYLVDNYTELREYIDNDELGWFINNESVTEFEIFNSNQNVYFVADSKITFNRQAIEGTINFQNITTNKFIQYTSSDDILSNVQFSTSVIFELSNSTYENFKSAIELDIQANSEVPTPSYVLYPINANNDTFTYLGQQIVTNISTIATTLADSYVFYRGVTYNFLNASNGSLTWQDSVSKDSINFGFQTHNDYPVNKFFYFNFTDTEVETFVDIVYFYDAEFIADNITAPMNTGNFITDLIALLTGGITGTSTAMGVGLSSLVDALAIQNNAMSPFMSVIFAFGGIALALALCRWIVNLLSSLGQRNR